MRLLRDALRATVRGAAARPGFAVLVVLTFAVGIGANTAIFTVADATLRRGLPYPAPERLVALFETRAREGLRPHGGVLPELPRLARGHALVRRHRRLRLAHRTR